MTYKITGIKKKQSKNNKKGILLYAYTITYETSLSKTNKMAVHPEKARIGIVQ